MRHAALVFMVIIASTPFAIAQQANKNNPPSNLSAYSVKFWPQNSLRLGEVVSTQTPYGTLTCKSIGRGKRECSLK